MSEIGTLGAGVAGRWLAFPWWKGKTFSAFELAEKMVQKLRETKTMRRCKTLMYPEKKITKCLSTKYTLTGYFLTHQYSRCLETRKQPGSSPGRNLLKVSVYVNL